VQTLIPFASFAAKEDVLTPLKQTRVRERVTNMVSNDKHTSSMSHTDETTHTKKTIPWLKWLFPITGMFALLWFLIRVIPKP